MAGASASPPPASASSSVSGRWSDSPWWNHSATDHTIVAPTTWMPTSTAGSRVKYWVYPMIPWTTMAPSRIRPDSWIRAGASDLHRVYSTARSTKAVTQTVSAWIRVMSDRPMATRLAPLPPAWGPAPVVAVPATRAQVRRAR